MKAVAMPKRVAAFEDLEVFQRADRLSLEIHRRSLAFPSIEQHALGDQVRRASKSICANHLREHCRGICQAGSIGGGVQALSGDGDGVER